MYSSLDIAKYIIYHCNCIDRPITNSKLNSLLYFVQGLYLSIYNKPCFSEEIMLCDFGICIQNVYDEYKIFGNNIIYRINNDNFDYILDVDKEFIDMIINTLSKYSSTSLYHMLITSLDRIPLIINRPIRINKYDLRENFVNKYITKGEGL